MQNLSCLHTRKLVSHEVSADWMHMPGFALRAKRSGNASCSFGQEEMSLESKTTPVFMPESKRMNRSPDPAAAARRTDGCWASLPGLPPLRGPLQSSLANRPVLALLDPRAVPGVARTVPDLHGRGMHQRQCPINTCSRAHQALSLPTLQGLVNAVLALGNSSQQTSKTAI